MKKTINYFLVYLLSIGCMNAQEEVHVIVENRILISPDTFIIKIVTTTNQVLEKEWMRNMNYISRDSALEIIKKIDNVKRLDKMKTNQESPNNKYLNTDYFEVYGIESYNMLKQKLAFNVGIAIEETKLSNFGKHEKKLIKTLLKESREKAQIVANEKNKTIERMIEYKEIKQTAKDENITRDEDLEDRTGFGVLKQKFIEFNHEGYTLNKDGKIILQKSIEVIWKIN